MIKILNTTTAQLVRSQLRAMGVPLFEVGAYKPAQTGSAQKEPEMLMRTWDADSLMHSVGWLRLQNLQGRNIYIRPKGEHPLSLLDDLTVETISKMAAEGFNPAVVVETSPGNFQAWVNHGEILSKEISTRAARALTEKFHGDPSSADWRHFGRLGGFTNRKDKYRANNGLYPFVKLIEATGAVYPASKTFVIQIRQAFEHEQGAEFARRQQFGHHAANSRHLQTITDFRFKPDYQGDGNRIDLAYAIYALAHGLAESEVREAIASRDLSHKGSQKRQADYINRTVQKAWNAIRGQPRAR